MGISLDAAAVALKADEIRKIAIDHCGRYLMRRRFERRGGYPYGPTELDLEIRACKLLVSQREARWISGLSNMAPGIELVRCPDR